MTRTQKNGDDTVRGKVGLTARGRKLLSHLRVAQDKSKLDDFGLPSELIEHMVQSGFLELQDETMPPIDYQDDFAGWKSQRGMLIDHIRTLAFQDAIMAVVQPGDRVVDVGTGSGILAMLAARQGAAEVFALEVTDMASWAARIAEKNGLSAVRVLRGDAAAFKAPGPVDVIMGEFAGMYFLEEWRHYAAFAEVRDRTLRPGGAVIPRAARLYLSAIDSRKLYRERGYGFWESPVYGLDFSDVLEAEIAAPRRYIISADHNATVCTREIAAFDFLTGTERDYFFTTDIEFPYAVAGSFHGFIGHFELDMAVGKVLSTGTAERETCWHHSYFPVPCIQVPAGSRVAARVRTFIEPEGNLMCIGLTIAGPNEMLDGAVVRNEHVYVLE